MLFLHQGRLRSFLTEEKGLGRVKGPSPAPLHLLEAWRTTGRQTSSARGVRQERGTSCWTEGRGSRRLEAPGGAEGLKGESQSGTSYCTEIYSVFKSFDGYFNGDLY